MMHARTNIIWFRGARDRSFEPKQLIVVRCGPASAQIENGAAARDAKLGRRMEQQIVGPQTKIPVIGVSELIVHKFAVQKEKA
jgi:hypothetical protein